MKNDLYAFGIYFLYDIMFFVLNYKSLFVNWDRNAILVPFDLFSGLFFTLISLLKMIVQFYLSIVYKAGVGHFIKNIEL